MVECDIYHATATGLDLYKFSDQLRRLMAYESQAAKSPVVILARPAERLAVAAYVNIHRELRTMPSNGHARQMSNNQYMHEFEPVKTTAGSSTCDNLRSPVANSVMMVGNRSRRIAIRIDSSAYGSSTQACRAQQM